MPWRENKGVCQFKRNLYGCFWGCLRLEIFCGNPFLNMAFGQKYFRKITILLNRFLDRLGPQILHEDFLQDLPMVCFVVTQHSESELSLCLRYSKTSCRRQPPKHPYKFRLNSDDPMNPMIIQKEEAVFTYNLFSLKKSLFNLFFRLQIYE